MAVLALILLPAGPASAAGAEPAKPARPTAAQAVREARRLVQANKLDEAAALLSEALDREPTDPELHNNLGYIYEVQGRSDDALDQYAATRMVAPSNQYAAERLEKLMFGRQFPMRLRVDRLAALPVRFARFAVKGPDGVDREVAVTLTVLYPPEMHGGGQPVAKTVPPGVADGAQVRFNRAIYAFVQTSKDEAHLHRCWEMYYPSRVLSQEGRDYGALASALARMAGRFEAYLSAGSLTEPDRPSLRLWLCEGGPAGGEHKGEDIFLYQVSALRPGEEWLRELAHEMGHARLPKLPGYSEPEASISGLVGEEWLLSALAYEAEQITGQPWTGVDSAAWLGGLWGIGALNLADYLRGNVAGAVEEWAKQGPYAGGDRTGTDIARANCGFTMWVQAAHGLEYFSRVLGGELGTAAGLTARYRQLVTESPAPLTINATAGWADKPPAQLAWLPFGNRRVAFGKQAPWRALCYLPAGTWKATADGKALLVGSWQPLEGGGKELALKAAVTSRGEWGRLQLAPADQDQLEAIRFIFSRSPEA
jgi:tetratricopeptide (TPR) repeat protein